MTSDTERKARVKAWRPSRNLDWLRHLLLVGRIRLGGPLTSLVYYWYTKQLTAQVSSRPIPEHIALILDGNRRFALQIGELSASAGHRYGAQKVKELIRWCDELAIPAVTIWGLSTDNLKRSPAELEQIFEVVRDGLNAFLEGDEGTARRRVRAVGRLDLLPDDLRSRIREVEKATASAGPWLVNVAVAYGGRDEIIDAFKRYLASRHQEGASLEEVAQQISGDNLQRFLYSSDIPEPNLIIRTSGELRLSGFMLWQSVYSELYFCDALWPAFRKIDFLRAIRNYQGRQRRYGK